MKTLHYLVAVGLLIVPLVSGCTQTSNKGLVNPLATLEQEQAQARKLNSEALTHEQDTDQQRRLLEQALCKDELFAEAHNNLGVVLYRQGRLYDAAEHFQRAADLLPGSPTPRVNLAILHANLGQWDRALPYAREAYQKDRHDIRAARILAECLVEKRDTSDELTQALQQMVMLSQDDASRRWAMEQLKTCQDTKTHREE